MSAKRPPQSAGANTSANVNGAGQNGAARNGNRARRDGLVLGRGQRVGSSGIRSAGLPADVLMTDDAQSRPYGNMRCYLFLI